MNIRKIKSALRVTTGNDIISILKKEFSQIEECTASTPGVKKISVIYNTVLCLTVEENDKELQNIIMQLKNACIAKMKELVKQSNGNSEFKTKFYALTNDATFMPVSEKAKQN